MRFRSLCPCFFAAVALVSGYAHSESLQEQTGGYLSVTYPQGEGWGEAVPEAHEPEATGSRLTLGYRLHRGLHVEATVSSLRNHGPYPAVPQLLSQIGSIATLVYLPLSDSIRPYFKVGLASVSDGVSRETVSTQVSGVGLVVPLDRRWSARIELERMDRYDFRGGESTRAYAGIEILL